jgi:hypothetical protein
MYVLIACFTGREVENQDIRDYSIQPELNNTITVRYRKIRTATLHQEKPLGYIALYSTI